MTSRLQGISQLSVRDVFNDPISAVKALERVIFEIDQVRQQLGVDAGLDHGLNDVHTTHQVIENNLFKTIVSD
jgi:hypothetical protein